MDNIQLKIIRVKQPIGELYISKITPEYLLEMSVVDRRRIEEGTEFLGIQREIRIPKVNQIKSYLKSIDATFPNSIILNTTDAYINYETQDTIELKISPDTFTIIDGQHRLEGFRNNFVAGFELIVTIFRNLELDQQANIFSTINSQQTKVDPSLNLNLELNNKVYTPKKMMIEVAQSFNYDKDSPWYNSIKFMGAGFDGIISLSAFVSPLLDVTYPESEYYQIRNALLNTNNLSELPDFGFDSKKYFFWPFYKRREPHVVYKILYNYFNALKNIFPNDWLNEQSLLTKTTGYNAIIKLFKDLAIKGIERGELTYGYFYEHLKPLRILNGLITTDSFGASGLQASNELYRQMKEIVGY